MIDRVRWLGVLAIGCVLVACKVEAFACGGDGECSLGGEPGLCVAGNCAYPDATCPSGYRYAAGLGSALAGECVAEDDVSGTGPDSLTDDDTGSSASMSTAPSSTTVDPTTESTGSSTTDGAGPTSTDPVTDGTSSGATTMMPTGTGTTTTGAPVDCSDELCAECLACVAEPGAPCANEAEACDALEGCPTAAACLEMCVGLGVCSDTCCVDLPAEDLMATVALIECRVNTCSTACAESPPPVCE